MTVGGAAAESSAPFGSPMGKTEKWARGTGREPLDDRAAGGDDLAVAAADDVDDEPALLDLGAVGDLAGDRHVARRVAGDAAGR